MTRSELLCVAVIAAALASCSMGRAADDGRVRLETKWLRVELDPASGAITALAADPSGGGDFSHPVAAGPRPYGISPACRTADGQVLAAEPGDGFAVSSAQGSVAAAGLRIGDGLSARLEASVAPDAAELTVRAVIRAEAQTSCQWAGLLFALDPALAPSTVCFAGRQGLASASPGRLVVPAAPYAGAVCKEGAERTFVFTSSPQAGVEIETSKGRAAIAVAPAIGREPVTLRPGDTITVAARLVFGPMRVAALKPVTSKFLPQAQDFIFWTSHIATTRPFAGRWAQETAAVIDPGLPPDIQQAYRRCWLRDVAHGWKSGMLVAGPEMLEVMRAEILLFAGSLDEAGQPPTSIGEGGDPVYGNLDSAGLLIGMIYDYLCRTGDIAFLRSVLPQADRMGGAIAKLVGPHDLPVIGEGGDTYPDLGFVKGEQTYLTAVCYDAMRKLARLHEVVGEPEPAGSWHTAAGRVSLAANRLAERGGLWDPERGVYIGWRKPDGSVYRDEDSFANLWAIYSGLCSDGDRVRAIFDRLNANWQRYYLDGLCPTALSIAPYPGGLNQWVPWVGGWDVYLRAKLSEPKAEDAWRLLWADYQRTDFPYREASGFQQQDPNAGNRGRIWDSWGLLQAIYAGHYGIEMTPAHLRLLPRALAPVVGDSLSGLSWRDATYDIALRGRGLHVARVTVDGAEVASCVLPLASGAHQVELTESAAARKAFVIDLAPTLAMLAAEHRDKGIYVEGAATCAGRYWLALQWPSEWGALQVESGAGVEFPQAAPLAGDRAALLFSVGRPGKFSFSLKGSGLLSGP